MLSLQLHINAVKFMEKLSFTYVLGVDTSKEKLDFVLSKQLKLIDHSEVVNTKTAIKKWIKSTLKSYNIELSDCLICTEHTGLYNYPLIEVAKELGCQLCVENASNIKYSLGMQRGKDDKVDAIRIAEYAFRFRDKLKLFRPLSKSLEKLKCLGKLRSQLIRYRSSLKGKMKELDRFSDPEINKLVEQSTMKTKMGLDKDIHEIEVKMDVIITEDDLLANQNYLLCSVVGIGKLTSCALIVATNAFSNGTTAKQMACYSGVAPFKHQSGKSLLYKERVSHKANKEMKRLFHLCAVSACRTKGELGQYYQRKILEGKHKMSVINAVRNKIIHRAYAVIKRNSIYQEIPNLYLQKP